MGRHRILIFGLLTVVVVGILVSLPAVRQKLAEVMNAIQLFSTDNPGGPKLPDRVNDKEECGYCHSDKSRDFSKKYQHAPFAKWFCKDCHAQHTVGSGKYEYIVEIDKLCTTCHFNRKPNALYSYQHMPYEKGHCTDCHDPHASDYEYLLRMPQKELCASCHRMELFQQFSVKHKPYEIGACADCHDPHASKYRGMTRLPGKALCFTCHYDRQSELLQPVQHLPFSTGECVNCHGAHATNADALLLLPGNSLCLSCHVGLNEKMKNGYVHTPVKRKCTECHVPHASRYPALLPEPRTDLCFKCHGDMRPDFKQASVHPVGNGLLECDGCHDPHVGPEPNMLRKTGNQLCYICHLGLEATYEKLAHAKKADGPGGLGSCLNCHVPHGSNWKPLLLDRQEPMCNNCHTKISKARINHPFGEKYDDRWHGGTMHCTSCHGPHGTPYEKFTLLPDDGFCLKCHGERRKDNNQYYSVHRLVPQKNEKKPKEVDTKVPPRRSNKTKAVNKKAGNSITK